LEKVKVTNLTKIFGKKPSAALEMIQEGAQKEEVLEKTGCTVGVNQASFSVKEGEFFVIMGLSGSGKSTLIRMINRLIDPTEGSVYIDGEDVSQMDAEQLRKVRREKISMVFQNFGLFPHRTLLENTEYGLEVQGIEKDKRRKIAEKALDNAGLLAYKNQLPNQLSGGMQQRVGLARALANDPEILLMDEAFSALDPLIRRDMQDELLEMQKTMKKTILFITHDLNESLRLGDRIAIMKDGEIVQVGTGEEILTQPADEYVRRFVEDVNRAKVLTAENIMEEPTPLVVEETSPSIALARMQEEELSNMLIVDENKQLKGYVVEEEVEELKRENKKDLHTIIRTDIPTAGRKTLLNDLFHMSHESVTPIAVLDKGRLVGIVIRNHIVGALAKERKESIVNG